MATALSPYAAYGNHGGTPYGVMPVSQIAQSLAPLNLPRQAQVPGAQVSGAMNAAWFRAPDALTQQGGIALSPLAANVAGIDGIGAKAGAAPDIGGTFLGMNQGQWGNINTGLNALGALGGVYGSLRGIRQAKDAFNFNKGVINTNLANSIGDFNRRLEDVAASRAAYGGMGQDYVDNYVERHRARDTRREK